jgi:hypothetical protein
VRAAYAFAVDHGPVKPANGWRIDFAGKSVVFSGDRRGSRRMLLGVKERVERAQTGGAQP